MAATGLFGPFPLDHASVDRYVGNNIGAYALGHTNPRGEFVARFIGRSDTDVNRELKTCIGRYTQFEYRHFLSARAAFEKECALFHDLGGATRLDNTAHPARPTASQWACPRCTALR